MAQQTVEDRSEADTFRVGSRIGRGAPPRPPFLRGAMGGMSWPRKLIAIALALVLGYVIYVWEVRRVVVDQGNILVLLKKNGTRSLRGDQIIVPREPKEGTAEHAAWEKEFGDCNGIL